MIKADFFPTDPGSAMDDGEYTAHMINIPITTEYAPIAYWLGYISYDNLPQFFHPVKFRRDEKNLYFEDVSPIDNFDCCYLFRTPPVSDYGTAQVPMTTAYIPSREKWDDTIMPTTAEYVWNFGNKVDVMKYAVSGISISFYGCAYNDSGSIVERISSTTNYTITDFYNFLFNDSKLQIVTNSSTIEFSYNEIETGNMYKTANGLTYRIFVIGYGFEDYRDSDSHPTNRPCFSVHTNDGERDMIITGYPAGNSATFSPWIDSSQQDELGYFFGCIGTISLEDAATLNYDSNPFVFAENVLIYKRDYGSIVWVRAIFGMDGIKKHFCLTMRLSTKTNEFGAVNYGYIENEVYAPYVTENNEFTATLITGNLDDENFKSQLRPWQYNINEWENNDYTEEDRPSYSGDDDADSGGDDITGYDFINTVIGASNNFITMYALTQRGITGIGESLWAKLSDEEFWITVGTVTKNDASINPADIMKYFTSLRFFPMDLSLVPHSLTNGIYVGRAVSPLTPPTGVSFPIRLLRNIITVDGGSVSVPRMYNDFRDCEPCCNVQVTVPYCGSVTLPASEVMGKTLYLKYNVDLQTGSLIAVIEVSSTTYYVVATLAGTCGASIPITANNNIEFLQRIATVGQAIFSGGASGANSGAEIGNYLGGEVGAVTTGMGAVAGGITGGVGALAGLPPVTIHKQGYSSGFSLYGGVNRAYITIVRQKYEIPSNYGHTVGHATSFTATIRELNGFTKCTGVDTSGIPCNESEREEIKRLLEGGIYV